MSILVSVCLACSIAAASAEDVPLGPFEVREEYLLTHGRLSLPARSAQLLPPGAWQLRVEGDWGNDFTSDDAFLVDGEHATLAATYRRGVTERLTVSARVPVAWRGGGIMDGIIETFHDAVGFGDGGRPHMPRDQLVVRGAGTQGPLVWEGRSGIGLGRLEIDALVGGLGGPGDRRRLSLNARLALPTATGAIPRGNLAVGVQALSGIDIGARADLHAGIGATFDATRTEGIPYRRTREFAFVAVEWRPALRWALLGQVDLGTRLTDGIERYPGVHSYLRLGVKRRVGRAAAIEAGFSEGITAQRATTDFGVFFGIVRGL